MNVLDTNIIVRLLTGQPAHQASDIAQLLERAHYAGVHFVVPAPIVAETLYVLTKTYGHDRQQVAGALIALFASGDARPADPAIVPALTTFAGGADFPDAYIMALANQHECRVISFDQRMAGHSHVIQPSEWQATAHRRPGHRRSEGKRSGPEPLTSLPVPLVVLETLTSRGWLGGTSRP